MKEATEMELYVKALKIVTEEFKGKYDKGGNPYIWHLMDVANKSMKDSYTQQIVSLLHDLVEDTNWTIDRIREEFNSEVADGVDGVTRRQSESYDDFIKRAAKNKYSLKTKIHDLENNMDITRLRELTTKDIERLRKYHKAYRYLASIH